MKLDVPFVYSTQYIPKGKRTPESVPVRASISVEVPEIDGNPAFRIGCPYIQTGYGDTANVSPFHAPLGETVGVYRAEEAYWVEICPLDRAQEVIANRKTLLRDPFSVFFHVNDHRSVSLSVRHYKDKEFLTRADLEQKHKALRTWDESERDTKATLLQRRAFHDIRAIDGRLCMRVSEPILDTMLHLSSSPRPNDEDTRDMIAGHAPPAEGYHIVIGEAANCTPSGFSLEWRMSTQANRCWRIDRIDEAVEFLDRENEIDRAYGRTSWKLHPATVTIGELDTSSCKYEGWSAILLGAIDHLRGGLMQHAQKLDAGLLTAAIDLQHVFERDGGRLTSELISRTRDVVGMIRTSPPKEVPYGIALKIANSMSQGYRSSEIDLASASGFVDFILPFWDRRDQAEREWIERMLPSPVLPAPDFDIVELPTLQRAQNLVDAGCDPAVLEAASAVPGGGTHVVSAESIDGKPLGYAAELRDTEDGPTVVRVFAPPAPNPSVMKQVVERFSEFTAFNIEASAENDALMGMTL